MQTQACYFIIKKMKEHQDHGQLHTQSLVFGRNVANLMRHSIELFFLTKHSIELCFLKCRSH
jgi:hypothetical protein